MYKFTNRPAQRTIVIQMSGFIDRDEMQAWHDEYMPIIASYQDKPHLILADMRGLKPCPPDAAAIMMQAIAHNRAHGAICCAHLSDQTITRLQARRLAREVTPDDTVTVDVASIEEAEALLAERLREIKLLPTPPKTK